MIAVVVGVLNVVLGIAYTTYGLLTISDLKRGWKTMGVSHFGIAWVFMTFTCGPHHLIHGVHVLMEGRIGGGADLFAVLVGLPAGVTFLSLRLEAWLGGRGDRFISGTPVWVKAMPTAAAVYATIVAAWLLQIDKPMTMRPQIVPNVLLIVVYMMIGYFVMRTQLRNRSAMHGWSLSGLSLGVVFPTCAVMHGVYATYAAMGVYHLDWHGYIIDWVGVPAALYFLWVVRNLHRRTTRDWNRTMMDAVPDRSAAVVSMRSA
jgi:hypothetical protein